MQEKISILYLDDEAICLEVFEEVFGDEYEVLTVSTLGEARAALEVRDFDIVISDQLMPETDGLTFLREVARNHGQAFRIMLTGSVGLGQVIAEVGAGIIHLFVTKPWSEVNMRQALERASIDRRTPPRTTPRNQLRRNVA
ncbi:MAG TPA: response regulator [Pyrinomonadaceae bacterium]